ncbi:hypothetical protein [Agrococcus sp. ARC_14]|uniref:hypothetical protein n=1 Tax=Agrococcus sp. ARC_14 TaxID=2919927 RepID=UPI001F064932|nr:hypothetical protein [Agrococcus sp. ARC_14]MCH1882868.1 hypothetical protein [Agrococcus sp. ARC_14]
MGGGAALYGDDNWVLTRIVRLRDEGADIISSTVGHPDMSAEERAEVNRTVHRLADGALVDLDEMFGGAWRATLTALGLAHYAAVQQKRGSRLEKRRHYRLAYLTWIYEHDEGSMLQADDFLASGALWFGEPVAEEDLHEAGRWLKEQGYVDGPGVGGGRPDPLRVKITPRGSQAIEHELPLGAPDPAPSATHTYSIGTINGPAAIAQGSTNVTRWGLARTRAGYGRRDRVVASVASGCGPRGVREARGDAARGGGSQ